MESTALEEKPVSPLPLDGPPAVGEWVVELPVQALATGGSPRSAGIDHDHVEALAALDGRLPPIIVHWPTMRVIDGMHRLMAARLRGRDTILSRLFAGEEAAAFALAVSENIAHGLTLPLADRKRAARRILLSFPQWSARMVAAATGISVGTVTEIRKRTLGDGGERDVRIGRDGRARPANAAEGRRIAHELITKSPELSLRQIARAAGVSPETVRTLKNRLRESPAEAAAPVGTVRHQPEHPQGATLLARLKTDPALRLRESGRDLLRLLGVHLLSPAEWERLIAAVPAVHRAAVVELARDCAENWAEFARRVGGEPGDPGKATQPLGEAFPSLPSSFRKT